MSDRVHIDVSPRESLRVDQLALHVHVVLNDNHLSSSSNFLVLEKIFTRVF